MYPGYPAFDWPLKRPGMAFKPPPKHTVYNYGRILKVIHWMLRRSGADLVISQWYPSDMPVQFQCNPNNIPGTCMFFLM